MSLDVSLIEISAHEIYSANVTHNLGKMASAAGIYEACWHPEVIGAKKAKDIIPLLVKGIADMKARPEFYKQFDPPNGWGSYDCFIPWLDNYLDACMKHPEAEIEVSV